MTRDQFLVLVMPELPECPVPLIMDAANEVIEDFCRRTGVWTVPLDYFTTYPGVSTYQVDVPTGSRVIDMMSVTCGGRPMRQASAAALSEITPDWQSATADYPSHYELQGDGELRLWPVPTRSDVRVNMVARLTAEMSMTELPDAVMRNYRRAIAHGVMARLMLTPGEPPPAWANEKMAAFHGAAYESAIPVAISHVLSAGGRGELIIPPVKFG